VFITINLWIYKIYLLNYVSVCPVVMLDNFAVVCSDRGLRLQIVESILLVMLKNLSIENRVRNIMICMYRCWNKIVMYR